MLRNLNHFQRGEGLLWDSYEWVLVRLYRERRDRKTNADRVYYRALENQYYADRQGASMQKINRAILILRAFYP